MAIERADNVVLGVDERGVPQRVTNMGDVARDVDIPGTPLTHVAMPSGYSHGAPFSPHHPNNQEIEES